MAKKTLKIAPRVTEGWHLDRHWPVYDKPSRKSQRVRHISASTNISEKSQEIEKS